MKSLFLGAGLLFFFFLAGVRGADLTAVSGPVRAPDAPRAQRSAGSYLGGLVNPPLPKPRFTLTDTAGAPFDFWAKTQGYVTLLFFGYTRCPDECPLHMANVAMGLQTLPMEVRAQVKLVFVTTDPVRDEPHVLRVWLDRFDTRFIGLTGSDAAIEAAERAAGLPAARKTARAGGDYAVGHANVVLTYSKDNLAHLMYPGGVTRQDWAHDLPRLVNEAW
jgi:protein SCO1/2